MQPLTQPSVFPVDIGENILILESSNTRFLPCTLELPALLEHLIAMLKVLDLLLWPEPKTIFEGYI